MAKIIFELVGIFIWNDRVYIFYFCHSYVGQYTKLFGCKAERAAIQVAELKVVDGELFCDRNLLVTWLE